MARIFITGSSDGLGLLAAQALVGEGHRVVLHGRNETRGREALSKLPGAEAVVTGDLGIIEETELLAEKINALGQFDAVIHNAGLFHAPANDLFTVNTLTPYILTCLIQKPKRLIYLSSDMHTSGRAKLESFKTGPGRLNYSDTKLHVLMLCKVVARHWKEIYANAVNPGWVPTKMGGRTAPDSLEAGYQTQVWLATSNDENAKVNGRYLYHQKESVYNPQADDEQLQEQFISLCQEITGVTFPV